MAVTTLAVERHRLTRTVLLLIALLTACGVHAQGGFQVITGKEFERAIPSEFYLEGNAIPIEKRNAALIRTPEGHRVLLALLDTSGYSSQVQQKYLGMIIVEGGVSVCGRHLGTGSYGFGLQGSRDLKATSAPTSEAKFLVYSQDGVEKSECQARPGTGAVHLRPLQVITGERGTGVLLLGRYRLPLE